MKKNRKHSLEFKLGVINKQAGGESVRSLSKSLCISPSLIWRWVDQYSSSGKSGLLPKQHQRYTLRFRLDVVSYHKTKGVSLRESCMRFGIPSQSTLISWLRMAEQSEKEKKEAKRETPLRMKTSETKKKGSADTARLDELEKENLYLRAENDFLKKLDALVQKRQTPPKRRR